MRMDIWLQGTIAKAPEYSHRTKHGEFVRFFIKTKRTSGYDDILPVVLNKEKVLSLDVGESVYIHGRIMTRNRNGKLDVYVYGDEISVSRSDDCLNDVQGMGVIVKKNETRYTPMTERKIKEIIIAVNAESGDSAYIPCIVWAHGADVLEKMDIGTVIECRGRLQSRDYLKSLDNGTAETRTAYEFSIKHFTRMEDNNE